MSAGWGNSRPEEGELNYGTAPPAPRLTGSNTVDLVRRRSSDDRDDRDGVKRQRTDSWVAGVNGPSSWERPTSSSGSTPLYPSNSAAGQPIHTRFGTSILDKETGISPITNSPNLSTYSAQMAARNDPRLRPGGPPVPVLQRAATIGPPNPNQSPANNALGFMSPANSMQGMTNIGASMPDMLVPGGGILADPRASQIVVAEMSNITLDQIRNPNDVLLFVMRRMTSAVRTNTIREDLVAKHVVLKNLRQVVNPLPVPGQSTTNSKIEEQLDASRREIHRVEQKLQRYQMEADVGWRQLGLTIALGHLPSLAEVRDVEGVRNWIAGLKMEMGQYLEERMRDEVHRAEQRVMQASAASRPQDAETERRLADMSKALTEMRQEQAKQRRLDTGAVLQRLDALELEMSERRKMDAEAQVEIESLSKRLGELEQVFAWTRTDLDTLVDRVDVMGPKLDGNDEVERELRALIESAVASVPDEDTLVTSIIDRIAPNLANVLQKHENRYAQELRDFQSRLDERMSQLGVGNANNLAPAFSN